ncbi:MAG: AzlD domain-containing protein [Ilumatobacteraceae bacterium]
MTTWIVVVTIGVATYGLRVSMFVVLGRRTLPAWLDRPMTVVAPAAVAALVGTMALTAQGRIDPIEAPRLVALLAGFVAVRRTGNVMYAFVVGLPFMWVLQLAF